MASILSTWEADIIQDILDAKVKIASLEKEISELRNKISMTGGNARKPLEDDLAQKQTELVWAKKDLKSREDAAENLSLKTKNRYSTAKKQAEEQQKEADNLKSSIKTLKDEVIALETLYSKSSNSKILLEIEQKQNELKSMEHKLLTLDKNVNFLNIKESIAANSVFMELNASGGFNTYFKVIGNLAKIADESIQGFHKELLSFPQMMNVLFSTGVKSITSIWKISIESALEYFKFSVNEVFHSIKEALDPLIKPAKFIIGSIYGFAKAFDKIQSIFTGITLLKTGKDDNKTGQTIKNSAWNTMFGIMANSLYDINEWCKGLYNDAVARTKRETLNRKDETMKKPEIGIAAILGGALALLIGGIGYFLGKIQLLSKLITFGLIEPLKAIGTFVKAWKEEGLEAALAKGIEGFTSTIKSFGKFFSKENPVIKMFGTIGEKIESFFTGIAAKIGKMIEFVVEAGKGSKIISGLINIVGKFIQPIIGIFKLMGGFAKAFIKIVGPIGWIIGILSSLYDFYKGFSNAQGTFLNKLMHGLDAVIDGLLSPIDMLLEWIGLKNKNSEGIWNRIKNGFASLFSFDWAKKLFNFLPDRVLDMIGLKDWVQSKSVDTAKASTSFSLASSHKSLLEAPKKEYNDAKSKRNSLFVSHNENTHKKLDKLANSINNSSESNTNAFINALSNSNIGGGKQSNEDEVPDRIPTEIIGAAFASLVS